MKATFLSLLSAIVLTPSFCIASDLEAMRRLPLPPVPVFEMPRVRLEALLTVVGDKRRPPMERAAAMDELRPVAVEHHAVRQVLLEILRNPAEEPLLVRTSAAKNLSWAASYDAHLSMMGASSGAESAFQALFETAESPETMPIVAAASYRALHNAAFVHPEIAMRLLHGALASGADPDSWSIARAGAVWALFSVSAAPEIGPHLLNIARSSQEYEHVRFEALRSLYQSRIPLEPAVQSMISEPRRFRMTEALLDAARRLLSARQNPRDLSIPTYFHIGVRDAAGGWLSDPIDSPDYF